MAAFFIETAVPIIDSVSAVIGKQAPVTHVGWLVIAMLVWSQDIIYLIVPIHIAETGLWYARYLETVGQNR